MPVWEYRVLRLRERPDPELALNALGADRWELVAVTTEGGGPVAYLRRESVYLPTARAGFEAVSSSLPGASGSAPVLHATARVSARDDPGASGWVDTGVDLGEDSAGVSLSIAGEVQESRGRWVGPEGNPEHLVLNPAIGEELPAGCLVARVGEKGTVEPVLDSGFLGTAERGRLYLTINDESYGDNEGGFIVAVTVL